MVTSVSSPSPPASTAFSNDISVFSGASYKHTDIHTHSQTDAKQHRHTNSPHLQISPSNLMTKILSQPTEKMVESGSEKPYRNPGSSCNGSVESHHRSPSVSDQCRGRSQHSCFFNAGRVHSQGHQVEREQHGQVKTQDSHLTHCGTHNTDLKSSSFYITKCKILFFLCFFFSIQDFWLLQLLLVY